MTNQDRKICGVLCSRFLSDTLEILVRLLCSAFNVICPGLLIYCAPTWSKTLLMLLMKQAITALLQLHDSVTIAPFREFVLYVEQCSNAVASYSMQTDPLAHEVRADHQAHTFSNPTLIPLYSPCIHIIFHHSTGRFFYLSTHEVQFTVANYSTSLHVFWMGEETCGHM